MLDLSLFKPAETPVRGPDGVEYALRAASVGAGIKYQAAQFAARKGGPDAAPDWELVLEAELVLVSGCLFDAAEAAVPVDVLRGWPHATRAALFDWVTANSPELTARSKDSLLQERELIDRQLKELEDGADPKA